MAQDLFDYQEQIPPVAVTTPETLTPEGIVATGPLPSRGKQWKTSTVQLAFVAHHPVLLIGLLSLLLLLGSVILVPLQLVSVSAPERSPLQVGTVTFTSSGQLNENNTTGINDRVTLTLTHASATPPGQRDEVWLLPDPTDDTTQPLLLGSLKVSGSQALLSYSDPEHANLLAQYSGIEVLRQSQNSVSSIPPLDRAHVLYQGNIPAIATPNDPNHYSLLDHLRHLLAGDPTLEKLGLHGGLDIWLYRNSEKILEWSSAARDSWTGGGQTALIHRHLLRILDTLDGTAYVELSGDVPAGSPLLIDPEAGRIGLLQLSQTQSLPSYLTHVDLHLRGIIQAPGHTQAQQVVASKVDTALEIDTSLLQQVHRDAVALVKMDTTHLQSVAALALLNDLFQNANAAFTGQFDAQSGTVANGIAWVYNALQAIATFPVTTA